ncbi:GrpB family protein [Natrarchaeobius sp. A-rgal3]|uniref:GrpB family protein n=1 Tax=Natrarchaeobius versutus TaxID=1679078 RepID=UPI00350EE52C
MVGLERGTVELVAYDEGWRRAFETEAERLRDAVGERVATIEHVGSTAIEGMVAKPIVDVLLVTDTLDGDEAWWIDRLEASGYAFRPNDPVSDRLFFAKGPEDDRTHYVSVTERGSDTHREQLLFRDYLRANPAKADEYAQLKRELAADYPDDRSAYTERKSRFVRSVLQSAREEAESPNEANTREP